MILDVESYDLMPATQTFGALVAKVDNYMLSRDPDFPVCSPSYQALIHATVATVRRLTCPIH